ncbi:nuclear speckle splicing regulatory protein [Trifolium repens]|nr:nuclear speckle splicing regulatory protein [Trifolium repens]
MAFFSPRHSILLCPRSVLIAAKKKLIQMSKYDDDNDVDKEVKEQQKKALDEYPTTFDYDGVYDKMKEKVARPLIQDHEERGFGYTHCILFCYCTR